MDRGVWYLQVLDGPLDAPAMVLQGCLALLGGHTVHCVLHLRRGCSQCLSPDLSSDEAVAGAGHQGCSPPWLCTCRAPSAWSWDHPHPGDLQPLLGLGADLWPPRTSQESPKGPQCQPPSSPLPAAMDGANLG